MYLIQGLRQSGRRFRKPSNTRVSYVEGFSRTKAAFLLPFAVCIALISTVTSAQQIQTPPNLSVPNPLLPSGDLITWDSPEPEDDYLYLLTVRNSDGNFRVVNEGLENPGVTSWETSGLPLGLNEFRIRACLGARDLCSDVSEIVPVQVISIPSNLSVPDPLEFGDVIQWDPVPLDGITYDLELVVDSGVPTTPYSGADTFWEPTAVESGQNTFRIRACLQDLCSPFSEPVIVEGIGSAGDPLATPENLSVPDPLNISGDLITWDPVNPESTYLLVARDSVQNWHVVYQGPDAFWVTDPEILRLGTNDIRVRSCNSGVCGDVSQFVTVEVVDATQQPPSPEIPANLDVPNPLSLVGDQISWGAVSGIAVEEYDGFYVLTRKVDDLNIDWSIVYSGKATTWSTSEGALLGTSGSDFEGKVDFRIRACFTLPELSCSDLSDTVTVDIGFRGVSEFTASVGLVDTIFEWADQTGTVEVYRTTQSDCDIANYTLCENASLTVVESAPELSLTDDFINSEQSAFVTLATESLISQPIDMNPEVFGFSDKSGVSITAFNDQLFAMGGFYYDDGGSLVFSNEIWVSDDGTGWEAAQGNSPFTPRAFHKVIELEGQLYLFSGEQPRSGGGTIVLMDIWHSSDGVNWEQLSDGDELPLGEVILFNDRFWLVSSSAFSDSPATVWSSADGLDWVLEQDDAPFGMRNDYVVYTFDNKLWLYGGFLPEGSNAPTNDVWSSIDGINWVLEAEEAGIDWRVNSTIFTFDGTLFLVGGHSFSAGINEIYSSTDGINWALQSSPIISRMSQQNSVANLGGRLWLNTWDSKDIWYSDDAIEWRILFDPEITWSERPTTSN